MEDNTKITKQKIYKPTHTGLYIFLAIILSLFAGVLFLLTHLKPRVQPVHITFPEGITNTDMARIISSKIPTFNQTLFLQDTQNLQGQLFPDTYFVYPTITPILLITKMNDDFNHKTGALFMKGYQSYSKNQIITMASLVQKEAENSSDSSIIAGILWKRLAMGMPLQVDAAPTTYANKGLPSYPINNPGLSAIQATINPTVTPYLYYLHDKNGMIHLASTYTEHMRNIKLYLK